MASNGQRPARTAQDVAQLEADNEYLHNELERVSRELAVTAADRSRMQVENAMLEGRARENLIKATRMETIVRQISAGLVSALQEITQERVTDRAVRRHIQEQHLEEETGPAPSFLQREDDERDYRAQTAATARARVQPETRREPDQDQVGARESDQDRADRLRGAAEHLATSRQRPLTPRIDHTLADRDPRMPGGPFTIDEGALEQLAGNVRSNK